MTHSHTYTDAYTIQLAKIQIFSHIHQTFQLKIKKKVFFLHKKPKNRYFYTKITN